ncbi:MAG: MBL fold metallo-hydrolase [Dehalococcoidales bacterium]|nr:MBL fold metallo-hydrolase [Dehalococcoidales bacterium]
MGLRLTTLSENTAGQGQLLAEWGLGLLIESSDATVLLDTGAGDSLVHNADVLGIDLRRIDKIVLSHGHSDHTGGLRSLLTRMRKEVEIIAHPDALEGKYSRREGQPERYIGLPWRREELESLGARFIFSREPVRLGGKILTTGEVPMHTDFEQTDSSLFVKGPEGWTPDTLADDQALVIETGGGLVVALGCAHRGMINTLHHARSISGGAKIRLVLGGCHLLGASDERIWYTISSLNEMGVKKLAVSHCTGMHATMLLARTYGDDFIFNHAGSIIDLE